MSKATTYQRRARDFAQREDWDAALVELRQAIASDGSNPVLHNHMGDLFLRKDEITQACQHFEKAIELYGELGLQANAVALCRKVIRLCPSRVEVRYRLACLRHEQGLKSETTASFADYLEHLAVHGQTDAHKLEEQCRDLVEKYPETAPIGKILEKLEEARAFAAAFEMVQKLAQRAADAGDDEAARRYTTKMRSLRVLVEARGGDLPGEPTTPERKPATKTADSIEFSGLRTPPVRPGIRGVPASAPEAPDASLQLEDIRGTIARSVFGADLPAALAPQAEIDLEIPEPSASITDAWSAPDELQTEYELPETSLDDVVQLFGPETQVSRVLADSLSIPDLDIPSDEPADVVAAVVGASGAEEVIPELAIDLPPTPRLPPEPEPLDASPRGWMLEGDTSAPEVDPMPEQFTAPFSPTDLPAVPTASTWAAEASISLPEIEALPDLPALPAPISLPFALPEPLVAAPPALARAPAMDSLSTLPLPAELYASVWVPDADSDLAGPQPQEGGSTHELAEVIDTFRRQMALALGDDAAARYDLGVAYFEMGLYGEALAEFEAALISTPLRERSLEMMAASMAMQGRHAEILDLLAPVVHVQADPRLGLGLRFSMGVACEALGRSAEARQHFEAVARVDGSYRDVCARLQRT